MNEVMERVIKPGVRVEFTGFGRRSPNFSFLEQCILNQTGVVEDNYNEGMDCWICKFGDGRYWIHPEDMHVLPEEIDIDAIVAEAERLANGEATENVEELKMHDVVEVIESPKNDDPMGAIGVHVIGKQGPITGVFPDKQGGTWYRVKIEYEQKQQYEFTFFRRHLKKV